MRGRPSSTVARCFAVVRWWLWPPTELRRTASNAATYRAAVRRLTRRLRDSRRRAEEAEGRAAAAAREQDRLAGEREILVQQLQMFALWQSREQARLEAETAVESARKVRALGATRQDDDERV